jgi:hypothetical protein
MKGSLFGACIVLSATPLFAQTPATGAQPPTTPPGATPQSITMSGCVAGQGSDAQPYILNNPVVVPSSGATAPGAVGSTASAAGVQPPTVAPTTPPAVSPTLPPAAPPPPPSSVGTSGSAAAGTVGTAGTAGAAGSASAGAAAGASPGTVASGGTAAAISGYRLSGSDMQPWTGQRVEIVGAVVTKNAGVASGAGVSPAMPEFRVQSIRPVGGPCPQE